MGNPIHRHGDRYREWSSICEQYNTAPLTAEEMVRYLRTSRQQELGGIYVRLSRADSHGTSELTDDNQPVLRTASGWNAERCDRHGGFHHTYEPDPEFVPYSDGDPSGDVPCRSCGRVTWDSIHGLCGPAPKPVERAPAPVPVLVDLDYEGLFAELLESLPKCRECRGVATVHYDRHPYCDEHRVTDGITEETYEWAPLIRKLAGKRRP